MRFNIVIIVVDTLRKDYANNLETTLKKYNFVSYANVIAPSPWTIPTHASIFTGLYPITHGAHETSDIKMPYVMFRGENLLNKMLKKECSKLYLLTANPLVHPRYGLKGFDRVIEHFPLPFNLLSPKEVDLVKFTRRKLGYEVSRLRLLLHITKKGHITTAIKLLIDKMLRIYSFKVKRYPYNKGASVLLRKLEEILTGHNNGNPKFVFANLMEVHEPYTPSENAALMTIDSLRGNSLDYETLSVWKTGYVRQVRYVTEKILKLIENLEAKNVLSKTLFIVTSDHGQMLGEYGKIGHGTFLYDELLLVPLLIRYPESFEPVDPVNEIDEKWLSLVDLKRLVKLILRGEPRKLPSLYKKMAFAESYGIHTATIRSYLEPDEWRNIQRLYDNYRVAIYYKTYKAIFNVNKWEFTEIKSFAHDKPDEEVLARMKKEVVRFLQKGSLLRKVKIRNFYNHSMA